MNTGVIDTSALVKFVLPEEHSDEVRRLIVLHQSSAVKLLAPDYILVESANVLWKHVRRNNLRIEDAESGLTLLQQAEIELIPQAQLLDDALRFAVDVNVAVYDALFAVLAMREMAPLITADVPLIQRLASANVQTIGLDAIPWQE